jgi:DNA-binding response OmpR family regulator
MNRVVLVVDDEDDLAVTCARLLQREGWQVVTVSSRAAALDVIGTAPRPALAIVDRYLPDGDGLDVLPTARAAGTPVIVVTAYWPGYTRPLALAEGATAFLAKPFSTRELLTLVHDIAGRPTAIQAAPDRAPQEAP